MFCNTIKKEEIWKDIPNYEGLYQVSSLGRVKSLSRKIRSNLGFYISKEKILKGSLNVHGYIHVGLLKNNKKDTIQMHQLMAMAFLGHTRCGHELVIDHKNNIKTDNRLENLQIVTHRHNLSKDKKNKTSKYTGVYWHKRANKWCTHIVINGKTKHLGSFDDEYDAYLKYLNELNNIKN